VVRALEEAASLDPEDPRIWSDLAAADLHLAQAADRPLALVRGLEAVLQAVALPGAPPEAYFNRALLLRSLYLTGAAREAWAEYLDLDPSSRWADEARASLRTLEHPLPESLSEAPLARTTPEGLAQARSGGRNLLSGLEHGRPAEVVAALEDLRRLAGDLEEQTGDRLFSDAVTSFERAWVGGGRRALSELLHAHGRLASGYRAYQAGQLDEAEDDLAAARRTFERRESPYALWAAFYEACALQQSERYQESLERLVLLDRELGERPYWSLRGYMAWMYGQNHLLLGRPLEAVGSFRSSLELFARCRLPEEQAALHALLADALLEMGREDEAWRELHQGLALGVRLRNPRRATILHTIAADANLQHARPAAAAVFQEQALGAARATGNTKIQLLTLTARGLQLQAGGDRRGAARAFEEARNLLDSIPDPSSRTRAQADLALLGAAVGSGTEPRTALRRLSTAIEHYESLDFQTPIAVAAYEERARLHAELGYRRAAAADLESSLRIYEGRVEHDASRQLRWTLHRGARRTYDRLISLYLEMGDSRSAFAVADRSHRFSLHSFDFAAQRSSTWQDLEPEAVQGQLGEDEILVFSKLLDHDLVTWVLDSEGLRFFRRPLDRTLLLRAAGAFTTLLRSGVRDEEVRDVARQLGSQLLPEDLSAKSGQRVLIFVPDESLGNLPFGALRLRTGDLLVEKLTTVVAPSIQVFLEARARQQAFHGSHEPGRVLLLTDPTFDRAHWPHLPALPAARQEGEALAAIYPSATHLRGPAATRKGFVKHAAQASVIYFAGHALINQHRSDRSVLVLSPDSSGDTGALYQEELYDLHLNQAPVVVLSACDTGAVAGSPSEGFSSLARAFLSSGATAVVASLWPVDDRATAEMMTLFNRALAAGAHPAEALRQAQLLYLRDEALVDLDPYGWAGFQVVGASPEHAKEGPLAIRP
jgi:CHAT domain-containing protein